MKALLKKEAREVLRTYRLWVVPALFLFLSLSAPAAAKFTPEILKDQLKAENITIEIPKPTAIDGYKSYLKNLTQVGLIAVILLSMGLVADEKARGILAQVVTKPVSRTGVVLSKWVVHGCWFLAALGLSAVAGWLYTLALFGEAPPGPFIRANLLFAVYLWLLFSLTLAAGAVFRQQLAAGAFGLIAFLVFSVMPVLGGVWADYSPGALSGLAYRALSGPVAAGEVARPLLIAVAAGAAGLIGGLLVFERQEL